MTALGRREGSGVYIQIIHSLWAPPVDGDLLLIPGAGNLGVGLLLAGCGQELVIGKGGVEEDDKNPK